jgi:uncharacterized repeat protein (TIGR03803 family)
LSRQLVLCFAAIAGIIPAAARAQSASVIYDFTSANNAGVIPMSPLLADSAGNLYGTAVAGSTYTHGAVFELSPPGTKGGAWTSKLLYAFGKAKNSPISPMDAPLTADAKGNLYGTVAAGLGKQSGGVVFELVKPKIPTDAWREKTLYAFPTTKGTGAQPNGANPYGGVVFGPGGNLYGTAAYGGANGAGVVFELSKAGTTWTQSVLYNFTNGSDGANPYSTVAFDTAGNIYGTALDGGDAHGANGTVFELSPVAGGNWTFQTLHSFDASTDGISPQTGVILDAQGNLYGTTGAGGSTGHGTVFEVSPPATQGGTWTETILHSFVFATEGGGTFDSNLVADSNGNLYGTNEVGGNSVSGGTVWELSPPAKSGAAWTATTLHAFTDSPDGFRPQAGVTLVGGNLVGTTPGGGTGSGVAYQITP